MRSLVVGAVAGALGVAAVAQAGWLGEDEPSGVAQSAQRPAGERTDSLMLPIEPGTPCVGASRVTVEQALAAARQQGVFVPGMDERLVSQAWLCGADPAFSFGDTTMFLEPGWENVDAEAKWASLAKEWGGAVQQIKGVSALVQPATVPGTKPQIMVRRDDSLVRLLGQPDGDIGEALTVAESLDLG